MDEKRTLLDRLRSLVGSGSDEEPRTRRAAEGAADDSAAVPTCPSPDGDAMLSCEEALAKVHEYIDGELDDVPASQVRQHFEQCQGCYPHLRLEQVFREALRRATSGQCAPDKLRTRITTLIDEARREEAAGDEG